MIQLRKAKTPKTEDLSGKTYFHLHVEKFSHKVALTSERFWVCRCVCGKEVIVATRILNAGTHISCGCITRHKYGKDLKHFTGYEEISGSWFTKLKQGAARRGVEFHLTIEDIWGLYLKQNKCCALSNRPLLCTQYKFSKGKTASVDRIDNNKSYTKDNVQLVHTDVNVARHILPIPEFIALCEEICYFQKNKKAVKQRTVKYEFTAVRRHNTFTGHCEISGTRFYNIKKSALDRNRDFNLTIEEIWDRFIFQKGLCYLSGRPISFADNTASVDRVDNNEDYYAKNIQIVHKIANIAKHKLSMAEFIKLCQDVIDTNKEELLLDLCEAAKILNVSHDKLRYLDDSGKLIAVRTKANFRKYRLSDLKAFIESSADQVKIYTSKGLINE